MLKRLLIACACLQNEEVHLLLFAKKKGGGGTYGYSAGRRREKNPRVNPNFDGDSEIEVATHTGRKQ